MKATTTGEAQCLCKVVSVLLLMQVKGFGL